MNLRKLARGQPCRIRIPGVCNGRSETVVLCHIRKGWHGMGIKPPDICAVTGCSDCHDAIDGRKLTDYSRSELDEMVLRALCEQLRYYVDMGILKW